MKRSVCLLLAVVLLLGMFPVTVSAAEASEVSMRDLEKGETYKALSTSQEMLDVIKDFEGFSATPYRDNTQWTVGYGSYAGDIKDPKPDIYLTEDEAEELLKEQIVTYEDIVNKYCKKIGKQPTQNQFDALLDLTYNCGGSWTRGQSVTSVLEKAVEEMVLVEGLGAYSRSGGKVSYVHCNRRIREALIFLYGEYYRAYGNQDCKSDIDVVSNHDLPYFKTVIFKANGGTFSNGKDDVAGYYAVGEAYGSFPEATRSGYVLDGYQITKISNKSVNDGDIISVNDRVEYNLELTAVWKEKSQEPEQPSEPEQPGEPEKPSAETLPFKDVSKSSWYYDSVKYTYEKRYMVGVSETEFGVNNSMTRAMMVTVLWRMSGQPAVTDEQRAYFTDSQGAYYTDAVAWAYANGIVSGVGDRLFKPSDPLTRQDAFTLFYRYCVKYLGMEPVSGADLSRFADQGKISSYAKEAVAWAVQVGLVAGSEEQGGLYILPKTNLNRAGGAALLYRFDSMK